LGLDLLLIPMLGISFWARDRGVRKQAAARADARDGAVPRPMSDTRDTYA
jgi:hypothetical protein